MAKALYLLFNVDLSSTFGDVKTLTGVISTVVSDVSSTGGIILDGIRCKWSADVVIL